MVKLISVLLIVSLTMAFLAGGCPTEKADNLSISVADVDLAPPIEGQPTQVMVTVRNDCFPEGTPVTVWLEDSYDGGPDGGQVVATSTLKVGQLGMIVELVFKLDWENPAPTGKHVLTAVVEGPKDESDLRDNSVSLTTFVSEMEISLDILEMEIGLGGNFLFYPYDEIPEDLRNLSELNNPGGAVLVSLDDSVVLLMRFGQGLRDWAEFVVGTISNLLTAGDIVTKVTIGTTAGPITLAFSLGHLALVIMEDWLPVAFKDVHQMTYKDGNAYIMLVYDCEGEDEENYYFSGKCFYYTGDEQWVHYLTSEKQVPISKAGAQPSMPEEPRDEEAPVAEPEIPDNFTTYTREGLFSISYPQDWVPATSVMDELFEEIREIIESEDPEVSLAEAILLFFGGKPFGEGYYPNVNILIMPRSSGYWTLDEIVEVESQYEREHTQGYREYSQVRTIVDGRDAVIIDSEDYDPDMGTWRYLQLFMTKDKYVWLVTSGVESGDFKKYEDTLYSVIKSLRILD